MVIWPDDGISVSLLVWEGDVPQVVVDGVASSNLA